MSCSKCGHEKAFLFENTKALVVLDSKGEPVFRESRQETLSLLVCEKCGEVLKRDRQMIENKIAGIPCLIDVISVNVVPPDPRGMMADSSLDASGYSEVEFLVCDRRGNPAAWLEKKMTDKDHRRIEAEILAAWRDE